MISEIKEFSPFEPSVKERFESLVRAHWEEVQREDPADEFDLHWDFLLNMTKLKMVGFIGAFVDDFLVGYYALMFVPSLHTKKGAERAKMAQDLGWFVHKEYRKGRVGVKLLKAAEAVAYRQGCYGNAVSIKVIKNARPEGLLSLLGYACTEHRYTKGLGEKKHA